MKKNLKENLLFCGITLLLTAIAAFCVTSTVTSRERMTESEEEMYYRSREQEFVQKTRVFLNEAGYRDSGIMLTRVVDAEGARDYTMTVHHHRISGMDEEGRESLARELEGIDFLPEGCTVKFLMTE